MSNDEPKRIIIRNHETVDDGPKVVVIQTDVDYRIKACELMTQAEEEGLSQQDIRTMMVEAAIPLQDIPSELLPPFGRWRKEALPELECGVMDWHALCEALEAWLDQEEGKSG